ncbi:MAG: hypothetical protein JO240_12260 [Solirubrobacterales bacterium]|nr:hypothetical protein [Solirubrobacterales bacterium]
MSATVVGTAHSPESRRPKTRTATADALRTAYRTSVSIPNPAKPPTATVTPLLPLRPAVLGELQGKPEAFKALWSHADDVTIMGAFGGFERGWDDVPQRLDWASAGIGASERRVETYSH